MSDHDLADLADRFLDGDLDAATWAQARATHGAQLEAALIRAQAQRAAIAGFARPPLPAALRARLLAAAPRNTTVSGGGPNSRPSIAPTAARGSRWWRAALPAALAAVLLVILLLPGQAPTPGGDAGPTVAKQEPAKPDLQRQREAPSPADKDEPGAKPAANEATGQELAAAAPAATATAAPAQFGMADEAQAMSDAKAGAQADRLPSPEPATDGGMATANNLEKRLKDDHRPAPAMAPPAPAAAIGRAEPASLVVAALWHTPQHDRLDEADAQRRSVAEHEEKTTVPSEAGPAAGEALALREPDAADTAAAERVLRITLRNQGREPLRLAAGSIRLVGLTSSGGTLWRTELRRDRETLIPPGEVVTWDEAVPVIPPGVARLRIDAHGIRSPELPP